MHFLTLQTCNSMKKKTSAKLTLNRIIIANLNTAKQQRLKGGINTSITVRPNCDTICDCGGGGGACGLTVKCL
jgi:hypothetical protein